MQTRRAVCKAKAGQGPATNAAGRQPLQEEDWLNEPRVCGDEAESGDATKRKTGYGS